MGNNSYELNIKGNMLTLKTPSFKAERGSVLHKGIYSMELTSALASGALILLIYLVLKPKPTFLYLIISIIQFIVFVIFFRMFILYEPILEVAIDKSKSRITVLIKKLLPKKVSYPLSELKDVKQDHIVFTPENPDGVRVIEKVALQHGTVIPGFGEVKEFYTIELEFRDSKSIMVFSSNKESEADDLYISLKGFINA